jgi:mycothiol synthase
LRLPASAPSATSSRWDYRPIERGRWRELWLDRPSFEPELWWLAEDGGKLPAVSLNAWHWSGDPTFGWIGTLCVRRSWRRRGLALALLRHSFADFKRRGATRVALGVDTENETGAVGLYERAGMRPVRRNDMYEREL